MDSGILSLTLFAALSSLLLFTDVDLSFHIVFFLQTLSSWFPIRPLKAKPHSTTKLITNKSLSNTTKQPTKPISTGDGRGPKPSIKVEIPDSDKRRLSSRKPPTGPPLYAPTSKGVGEHWGTHTGCPTVFMVNNKEYILYEDGHIYLCDEEGGLHSATEMPSMGGCRIPGEKFRLILDREGYICLAEDNSPISQRLKTWCLANDPQSGCTQLIPGRGCFSFRVSNCSTGSPLHNTMFGLGYIPEQNIEARNVTIHQLEQSHSPTSSTSAGSSSNPLPYPLTPTSPTTASGSPVSPHTSPEHTIAQGQTSIERRTCPQCNKVLRRPGALRIHMYSHMGHKPCRCPEANCGYASTNDTNLRRHIQTMHRRS